MSEHLRVLSLQELYDKGELDLSDKARAQLPRLPGEYHSEAFGGLGCVLPAPEERAKRYTESEQFLKMPARHFPTEK